MTIISDDGQDIKIELPCGKLTIISKKDEWIIKTFSSFRSDKKGYVKASRYIKTEFGFAKEDCLLHRLIIGKIIKGFQIDHKNRNPLDNRRTNLRLATRGENAMNKAKAKGCTSKYRGVAYRPNHNKINPWISYVSKQKKQNYLGYFKTEKEAAIAYDKKSKELWGEFAFLNFPDE